jgi:hypothetical protein
MTTHEIVQSMIDQIAELSTDAQAELIQALVEMRSQHLGNDEFDHCETTHP